MRRYCTLILVLVVFSAASVPLLSQEEQDNFFTPEKIEFDPSALPELPEGFEANILAHEPDLFHVSALAIDKQGRLYAGGGPQYRDPKPDTPKDSIWMIHDRDQDGKAEKVTEFATGFNSIQGLAFRDGELWVANAPDLSYVVDKNDDLKADKYVKVFTGLGRLGHGLHGLVWAPDGKLYMSKGNAQVQENAPAAFRKLQRLDTSNSTNEPINKVYSPENYEAGYAGQAHEDLGRGGLLRMDPDGENLEIYARGMRNPWDWTFGPGFDWLANDQDPGTIGDRVFMPFEDAFYGLNHPVKFDWMGKDPRIAPASYKFTRHKSNSLVGTVYYLHDHFPKQYRNIFYMNDWQNNKMYTFRPRWKGALIKSRNGMKKFADGGENEAIQLQYYPAKGKPLFRPTDLQVGPSGAMFVGGWGVNYGSPVSVGNPDNQLSDKMWGRVFRIRHSERSLTPREEWYTSKRTKPYGKWSFKQLIADLGNQVRTWRTDAQLQLVRRGKTSRKPLLNAIRSGDLSQMAETYAVWALGRIGPDPDLFTQLASGKGEVRRNLRIQAIRVLGTQGVSEASEAVADQLADPNPRVRMAAALNIDNIGGSECIGPLAKAMEQENDTTVFYAQWKALRALGSRKQLTSLLRNSNSVNVQGGALFALRNTPDNFCSFVSLPEKGGLKKVRKILGKRYKNKCK